MRHAFLLFHLSFCWLLFLPGGGAQPLQDTTVRYVELPYEWRRGKVIVPVTINGQSYPFILDTGGKMGISAPLARKLELQRVGKLTVTGITRQKTTLDLVLLPEMQLGDWSFDSLNTWTSDFFETYPASCYEAVGMIGREILRGLTIQFDHQRRVVILTNQPERLNLDPEQSDTLFLSPYNNAYLRVTLPTGVIGEVIFDSGSDDLIDLRRKSVRSLVRSGLIKAEDRIPIKGILNLGISLKEPRSKTQYRVFFDSLRFAGMTFTSVVSDHSKESGHHIGTGIFPYGKVTLDYQNRRFYFEPFAGNPVQPQPARTFGLLLRKKAGKLIVTGIYRKSPAEKAGIRLGQEVVSVNGIPAKELLDQACEKLIQGGILPPFEKVDLRIRKKNGKEKQVELVKYQLR